MIVVSDTSPITNLLKIGRIDLLHDLYGTVVVPSAVAKELNFLKETRRWMIDLDWIEVVELQNRDVYSLLADTLDPGEAEAIALSLELDADVLLIDEVDGRREAANRGLEVTGLIGVLLEAKRAGLIDLIRPEIDKLVSDAKFWMSPNLIDLALALAHEI